MRETMAFVFTFMVGTLGFFVFRRLKFPNPALLGSMFASGALAMAGMYPHFPTGLVSFLSNVTIGAMLGRQIDRNVLERMKQLSGPVFCHVAGMLIISLLCGFAFYATADVSLVTALVSGTAGGIAEMVIFGLSVNADIAVVTFMQTIRILVFVTLLPYMSHIAARFESGREIRAVTRSSEALPLFCRRDYLLLIVFTLLGGWLGRILRIPAGQMLGGMIAGGALALVMNKRYLFDQRIRCLAQICLGVTMGGRMTKEMVTQLASMLWPTFLVSAIMLAGCSLMAYFLYRRTGWDLTTCLLCSAPAGMSQVAVLAEEAGADSFTASVFHTVRLVGIIALYPWLIMPFLQH